MHNTIMRTPSNIGKQTVASLLILVIGFLTGCVSVPLASPAEDATCKLFDAPTDGNAGVYIYRNCFVGQAIKRSVSIDNERLGETSNGVYFYKSVSPGEHTLATQSEFGETTIQFNAHPGSNHFFEQYMTMGLFSASAGIKAVSEAEGKANVTKCQLAK